MVKKLVLSAVLAMGLASTAMASGNNVVLQGEYHDLSGMPYDDIKGGGVKANISNFFFFARKWEMSGDNVPDLDGTQIAGNYKIKLDNGLVTNLGLEYFRKSVDNGPDFDNWVYNLGVTKALDEGTLLNTELWYTDVDSAKDNEQLDLTVKTKLGEGLGAKIGVTVQHNGKADKTYGVFRAGVMDKLTNQLTGKLSVDLGKNNGMIYARGWFIEGMEVEYKVTGNLNYRIDKQNSIGFTTQYTSYSGDMHKVSFVANYCYNF